MVVGVVLLLLIAFSGFWALAVALGLLLRYGPSGFRFVLARFWRPWWWAFSSLSRRQQSAILLFVCLLALALVLLTANARSVGLPVVIARVALPLATLFALGAWGLGVELVQRQRYTALWAHRVGQGLVAVGPGQTPYLVADLAVRPKSPPWFFALAYLSLGVLLVLLIPMGPMSMIEPSASALRNLLETAAAGPGRASAWYGELDQLQQGCFWYLSFTGFWVCMCFVVSLLALWELTRPLPEDTQKVAAPVLDSMQSVFEGVVKAIEATSPSHVYDMLSVLVDRTQLACAMCGPGLLPGVPQSSAPAIGLLGPFEEGERLRDALRSATAASRQQIAKAASALLDALDKGVADASVTLRLGEQRTKLAGVALQAFVGVVLAYLVA